MRQILADAKADHVVKHERHDHPWCVDCDNRRDAWEIQQEGYTPAVQSATEAVGKLTDRLREHGLKRSDVSPVFKPLDRIWRDTGGHDPTDLDRVAHTTGFDRDVVEIVSDHIADLDHLKWRAATAYETCTRRAQRYLLLHRNPPVDTFDPAAASRDLLDDLLDRDALTDLPTLEPLIVGTLTQHAYALLGGRRSTYKSFIAVDMAACIATGKPWQGRAVAQGRVLYVAAEGAYGMHGRLCAWEKAWRTTIDPSSFTTLRRPVNLFSNVDETDRLIDIVGRGGYRFVVLDTLHKMSSGADGDRTRDMGPVLAAVDRIKRATAGGSVLVIAHTDANDTKVRGSTAVEDDADIVYRTRADSDGSVRLWRDKNKDGPVEDEINLRLSVMELPELGVDDEGKPVTSCVVESHVGHERQVDVSENERHLLDVMTEAFSESGADPSALMTASGLPRSSFYRARNRLLAAGRLVNVGTNKSPHYELSNAVQHNDDAHSRSQSNESNAVQRASSPPGLSPVQSHPPKGWDVGLDDGTGTAELPLTPTAWAAS